jgi:hypothetical protein
MYINGEIQLQIDPKDIKKCLAYLSINATCVFVNLTQECGTRIRNQVNLLKFDPESTRQNKKYVTMVFDKFTQKQIDLFIKIMKHLSKINVDAELLGGMFQQVNNIATNLILKSLGIRNLVNIPKKRQTPADDGELEKKKSLVHVTSLQIAQSTNPGPSSTAVPVINAKSTTSTTPQTQTIPFGTMTFCPGADGTQQLQITLSSFVNDPPSLIIPEYVNNPPLPLSLSGTETQSSTSVTLAASIMIAGEHQGIPLKEVVIDKTGVRVWIADHDPCSQVPAIKDGIFIPVVDIFKCLSCLKPSDTSFIFLYTTPQYTAQIGFLLRNHITFGRFAQWQCKNTHNPLIFFLKPSEVIADKSKKIKEIFTCMDKKSMFKPILSEIHLDMAKSFIQHIPIKEAKQILQTQL